MKPYGREKNLKGWPGKVDYHVHDSNHRRIENWWEGGEIGDNILPRTTLKSMVKREIERSRIED